MRWRRSSRSDPSRFGKGAIEGVAGPEAANNAGAQTSFIPLLTLGIPAERADGADDRRADDAGHPARPADHDASSRKLFWGVIASMWVGNLMLLVINLPLIGVWVSMLKIPYRLLFPAIVLFCCIGTYRHRQQPVQCLADDRLRAASATSSSRSASSRRRCCSASCSGPQLEENFRRAMLLADGDFSVFLSPPDQRGRSSPSSPFCCWQCCRRRY